MVIWQYHKGELPLLQMEHRLLIVGLLDESTDGAITVTQDTDVPSGSGFASSFNNGCYNC